jgi:hypothetical protein
MVSPASTASRPAFVTIASRPSVGRDSGEKATDLGSMGSGIFFEAGLDDPNQVDPIEEISLCVKSGFAICQLLPAYPE